MMPADGYANTSDFLAFTMCEDYTNHFPARFLFGIHRIVLRDVAICPYFIDEEIDAL